jgi:hypothetical protein
MRNNKNKTNSKISLCASAGTTPLFIRQCGRPRQTEVRSMFRIDLPCDLRKEISLKEIY